MLLIAALSAFLFISLVMMAAATQNSEWFGSLYSLLLVVNILGIGILLTLIFIGLYQLVQQYRARVIGSRLTLRLFGILVLISVIPVTVVFLFSLQALNRGIDSWFDVKIERAMDDALLLGQGAFDALKRDLLKTGQEMAEELEPVSEKLSLTSLNFFREQYNLTEITLYAQDGKIIASSSQEGPAATQLFPARPNESVMAQVKQGLSYANLDPIANGELRLRVVIPVYGKKVASPLRVLQILQSLPPRYNKLSESVQSSFAEYEKLVYLRGPLKFGFILSLSLVSLMTLLIVITGSIYAARRIVSPLTRLVEGTQAVARGDYETKLTVSSNDELGMLESSFNEMTKKIANAQREIKSSQLDAEVQRTYLETVLAHLSSGVLSLDADLRLRTYNRTAEQILGLDFSEYLNKPVIEIIQEHAELAPFLNHVNKSASDGDNEWQAEISISSRKGNRILIVRGTVLPKIESQKPGHVVVFDDATVQIQAQRNEAWGEVARRLAHEIKNPLTPIQLSAERLRHKCRDQLTAETQEVLDRATTTIVDQVKALKEMVNAFSDYARPVQLDITNVDLNALIADVVELYGKGDRTLVESGIEAYIPFDIDLQLTSKLPLIQADAVRLRQLIHNILRNSLDSLKNVSDASVTIESHFDTLEGDEFVRLVFRDSGPGFPPDLLERLFEPYVTTKEKGSGLGLAIVKRIVEEHHGSIILENHQDGGAYIEIILPTRLADKQIIEGDSKVESINSKRSKA